MSGTMSSRSVALIGIAVAISLPSNLVESELVVASGSWWALVTARGNW